MNICNLNMELYYKIRDERKKNGLEVHLLNIEIKNHELIGKKLYSRKKYKEYTVCSVYKHWYNGWYEVLMLVDNKQSHRVVMWRNINCKNDIVLNNIDNNRTELYYINEKGMYIKSY